MTRTTTDPLLQPFRLKHVTLHNRIMSTSHACGLEEDGGMPGETYQRYHEEKARGGLALTMFGGSSYVDRDSTWKGTQLDISTDRIIPYLEKFSGRIHAEGAAIMIQITHLGRRGETSTHSWLPTVAPSPIREIGHRSIPREMDRADIDRIVKAFGDAAARARQGGLDGLETMAVGHLIGQFFSPTTNKRTDEFGGSLENRCRFGLMVHEEIRNRVGNDFIVGMRIGIDETLAGGLNFDDCLAIAHRFERAGTIDFFNANYGRLDTELKLLTDCMPGMASPIAPWLERAGAFKRAVNLPVFHAARISDLATARHAIRDGLLDMVAMTRAHFADPHIVNKLMRGEEDRVRPCVGATYCMGETRPTCLHNPATGRERHWPQVIAKSDTPGRKIVIVGGGPAGLEAARVSAERGHTVVLFEAGDALGGQIRMASAASWRKDVTGIVDWREAELASLGVDVRLNHFAEAGDVRAENPDIVVIATGGVPHLDWLSGAEHTVSAWDIISGAVPVGENVLIYDGTGRHTALTALDRCATAGASITYATIDDRPAAELAYGERVIWRRYLAERGIVALSDRQITAVTREGNRVAAHFVNELTDEPHTMTADQVILEHGTLPADEIFHDLREHSVNAGLLDQAAFVSGEPQPCANGPGGPGGPEAFALYRIGDALSSRNIAAAIFDALRLCSVL